MSDEARGVALVVAGVASAQFGAGFAVTLFDELGPAGAVFLRLGIAARRAGGDLAAAGARAFGADLGSRSRSAPRSAR